MEAALTWLSSRVTHRGACDAFALSGVLTFPLLFFVSAPYGKLHRAGWGPALRGRRGWFIQEIVSPISLLAAFYATQAAQSADGALDLHPAPVHVFLLLWCVHYAHRAVLYPLQRAMGATTLPVVAAAVAFNLVNGVLVGVELARLSAAPAWGAWAALAAPRVVAGVALMLLGAYVNLRADATLRALRAGGPRGARTYSIPSGGPFSLFDRCACPHYLGEIVEWMGFATATGMRSGAVFAFWTFANLAPRARATRNWYVTKFKGEYPANRKALIPYIF